MTYNYKWPFFATLLALTLTVTRTQAQDNSPGAFTFQWGQEYELPKRHEDMGFVGNAKDGYIQIGHQKGNTLTFQKFDNKLKLLNEQEVDIDKLPRDYTNEFVGQLGSKYYWFFSTWDRGEDRESLYAQELDVVGGKLKGSAREVCHTTKITPASVGFSWGINPDAKWNLYFSYDKSKLLVEYRKKPERRSDALNNDVIGFQVFDSELTKMWGREARMPYTEKQMDNEDYQVDNRGNVYTLARVYDEERGNRRSPNYRYEILRWGKNNPQHDKINFRFTDKFVNSALLTESTNGSMIVSGYYSTKRSRASADGVFILRLDEGEGELKNVSKGTYEFPASLLAQYEKARVRRRIARKSNDGDGDVEASNMVLRSVLMKKDGSIQIFGEEHWIDVVTVRSGNSTSTTYIYHYNDILAMSIGADGNLQWAAKVPKQQTQNNGHRDLGYKVYSWAGNTYFFFMDRESNLSLSADDAPDKYGGGRGILTAVKVDGTGRMSKQMVYNSKDEKVSLSPTDFDEVGNNQLIVRGRAKRRESQAALITFQ